MSKLATQDSQRKYRDRAWWLRCTQQLIETARTGNAQTWHREMGKFVNWIDVCRQRSDLCEPDALATFITEFARVAGSVGEAVVEGASVETTLDRAIEIAEEHDQPVVSLLRAKAIYQRTWGTERPARLAALNEALRRAQPGSNEWVGVLIDLSEYWVEVSKYRSAVKVLAPIERFRSYSDLSPRQRLGVDVARGVALFTSFQKIGRADRYLTRACENEVDPATDSDAGAWLARALHYRARISEGNRRYTTALDLYLAGLAVQSRLPEDTNALGFIHLRIADLLAGCDLLNSAERHLEKARELFTFGSNTASGRLQCNLTQAAIYSSSGRALRAREEIVIALTESRRIRYWRGEFLSLGLLLLFDLKQLQAKRSLSDVAGLIRTLSAGELQRNNLLLMLRNLPVMLSVALHRLSLLRARPRDDEKLKSCRCPLHPSPVTAE